MLAATKAVVAIWLLFVPKVAVGAVGVPVNVGLERGAAPGTCARGRFPVTPPGALLARFTTEKFISDVNSDPPLRSTLKRWDESARMVSTPAAAVTAVPASAKAPQPDTPAPQVGGDDPSARLVAVSVVNAPEFGVVLPIVPGVAHGMPVMQLDHPAAVEVPPLVRH